MNHTSDPAFVVVITFDIPGAIEPTTVSVTLHPDDSLQTPSGTMKQLQDCTLGELLQFGGQLENELRAKYESKSLVDLVIEGEAKVNVSYPQEDYEQAPPAELWLEQMINIPDADQSPLLETVAASEIEMKIIAETPDSDTADIKEQFEDDVVNAVETENLEDPIEKLADPIIDSDGSIDEHDVDKVEESIAEPTSVNDLTEETIREHKFTTEEEDSDVDDVGAVPSVTVAKSELIHEEIEAESEATGLDSISEPEIPRVQILGRRRPIGHPTWTAVDILINEPAFRDTQAHSISSPDREVAGILVGPPPEKQPDGRYVVHISDTIIAKYTRMHGASVTYTPESWRYVNDKLAERYPDGEAMIVGWYHTHPGFGIFLSGMDRFIHQNFFTQIWHVALVLDPLARRSGFFCWDRKISNVDAYEFPWPKWAANSW